jgi:hypothetical protein
MRERESGPADRASWWTSVAVRAVLALGGFAVVIAAVAIWSDRKSEVPFLPAWRSTTAAWEQSWERPADNAVRLRASPDGSGDACTDERPCGLATVRDRVRRLVPAMTTDVVVELADGTFHLTEPLALGPQDSGTNGHRVLWVAAPGATPVFSGGTRVTGWTPVAGREGVFEATVPADIDTRQLFVDGVRGQRARGALRPDGWARSETGFVAPDESMASWSEPTAAEIVSFREWKALRCPIASVDGRAVAMAQPCWKNANAHDRYTMVDVTWVENAPELLDEPGEWYLDRSADRLTYHARTGEDLATAEVVVGTTQTLVSLHGTIDRPVHDIGFEGVTFSYDTWLGPSTTIGYPVLQAGWFSKGDLDPPDERDLGRTPGAVSLANAHDVRFEANTFTHLGAAGLDAASGSRAIGIVGNRFADVASHGIQVGEVAIGIHAPEDERAQLRQFDIRDNVVEHVGTDYPDAVGIIVTYAAQASIVHNDVGHLPYTGISLGWGWGTDSYAVDNVVRGNHVFDVMRTLRDGGAIYTLSSQPGSVIEGNHIADVMGPFGAIYLDEGTADVVVADNVVERAPRWLHIWTTSITRNTVVNNFADTDEMKDGGLRNLIANNVDDRDRWPPEAQAIIDAAGVDPDADVPG